MKRLYISADIEGVAGVVSVDHLVPGKFEYEKAREWMTGEVLAACSAAFESGIEEIVVSDSHGNGQNLLVDRFPKHVELVRSWPRPLGMMEGIDVGAYVGACLIGYHTGASDVRGVLAHTLHGGAIAEVRLNDKVASETVISAGVAAHFGVPVIMVSGDDAYIEHAREVITGQDHPAEGVITKYAYSLTSARMKMPSVVNEEIGAAVTKALSRIDEESGVSRPAESIDVDVRCIRRTGAELLAYLPIIERIDSHTIRFVANDMPEVARYLKFLTSSGALTPS